jgi:biotin synthase-like enzyme
MEDLVKRLQMAYSFEIGPIRPPNEAHSLLIRTSRNCPWNKCKFCNCYKGTRFELRAVEDIKRDIATASAMRTKINEISFKAQARNIGGMQKIIGMVMADPPNESFRNVALWLYGGGENVFLQDANSLIMKTDDLVEILRFIKEIFPKVNRITSYARSDAALRKRPEELVRLREAGLTRLHIGLESGYDPVLKYMDKGVTADEHIKAGKKITASGISLCEYVILGLGGKNLSEQHAFYTARALNEINPDFIRIRTLSVNQDMPLYRDVIEGKFIRASDEEIIKEERTFIENLECSSNYVSDHITNLLQELEGKLPGDKVKLLSIIAAFEGLSAQEKSNFIVGRRVGLYNCLKDMINPQKHDLTEQIKVKLCKGNKKVDPETIFSLMEGFI